MYSWKLSLSTTKGWKKWTCSVIIEPKRQLTDSFILTNSERVCQRQNLSHAVPQGFLLYRPPTTRDPSLFRSLPQPPETGGTVPLHTNTEAWLHPAAFFVVTVRSCELKTQAYSFHHRGSLITKQDNKNYLSFPSIGIIICTSSNLGIC